MNIPRNTFLLLLSVTAVLVAVDDSIAQPQAHKFDELSIGLVRPGTRAPGQRDELNRLMQRYARQLKKEKAQAYIIGYAPRVIAKEFNYSTYGERLARQSASYLVAFIDYKKIHSVDGGFRETAATELWIVPRGASPPKPTPTIKPEDVTHCPNLSVSGSRYSPRPNGPLEFKARLYADGKKTEPVFTWQLSQGTIMEGQGTDRITVAVPAGASGELVARVNVSGFSHECPTETTMATTETIVGIDHVKFEEYGAVCSEDEKARLDIFAIELRQNPRLQGYVIFYGGRCWSACDEETFDRRSRYPRKGEAEARAARIRPYLVEVRGMDPDRFVVIDGGNRESWTVELWLSAKGIGPPAATPTVQSQEIEYRKGKPGKREFCRGSGSRP
jgi:hypothetical protein